MNLERIETHLLRMPLVSPFETSFGVQTDRTVLLVSVSADGLTGWGECTAGEDPFYSAESTNGCRSIVEEYLVPALFSGRITGEPQRTFDQSDFVRGNHMARAAVEAALWDLEAQRRELPLHAIIGGVRQYLETGISIGIQATVEELVEKVQEAMSGGYKRIKIKIKPGWDLQPVEQIRQVCGDVPLMVDANAAYRPEDTGHLQALDRFELMMIEQPFHYEDLVSHAALQSRLDTPVCLDESISGIGMAHAAIALGACRLVNIKQGRVGGLQQAIRLHDLCKEAGLPVWAGGMLETGIGRMLNIALASLPDFTVPGDISASSRYWARDIIDPPVTAKGGIITLPSEPGLGSSVDRAALEHYRQDHRVFKPGKN